MAFSENSAWEIYSCTHLHLKIRNIQNQYLILQPWETRKEEQTKPKSKIRSKIIKIRLEISEIENRNATVLSFEKIKKIYKLLTWLIPHTKKEDIKN